MKDKKFFFRDDLETFTVKYYLLCNKCEFNINKFADIKDKSYICRIKIEELLE